MLVFISKIPGETLTHPEAKEDMGRPKGSRNVKSIAQFAVLELQKAGMTHLSIYEQLSVPRSTVSNIIRRSSSEQMSLKQRRGRKLKLNPRCRRRLLRMMDDNGFKPLHVIAQNFRTANGGRICTRTIQRYIHRAGMRSYSAVPKPYLTAKHIQARLHWAIVRQSWMQTDWEKVMSSDESSFTVRPIHLGKRVWRKEGTRFRTSNLVPNFKSGYVSLSVWGEFSKQGRGT